MATALEVPVLWKDITGTGIEGTEVVAADELPQCGWEGATVNDLIRLIDDKFENSAAASRASYVRQVKSLLLYGTHLSHGRLLSSVIVSLSACCPRLVATTRLVRAKSKKINIFVQPPNGRLLCLVCALDETIDEVKRKIEDRTGYPPAQQRLSLSGKHLYGSRTLAEYSAYSECTLYLVNRLCGGYINDSAKKFADVTDDSLVGVYEFSTRAPAWRKVGRGLNLEGQCGTPSCAAFRHWIVHQHGFNSFNLYRDGCIHCPMCASEVTPLTCLFYDCVWKYEGALAGDGVHLSSGWKSAIEDGKYHRFDVDEIRGIVA